MPGPPERDYDPRIDGERPTRDWRVSFLCVVVGAMLIYLAFR